MLIIDCPHCGKRPEDEFHCGGQAGVAYPDDPYALSDEEWAQYLFYRDNPRGAFLEQWSHSGGCRRWFVIRRDTRTYQILETAPIGAATRPDPNEAIPTTPTDTGADATAKEA